MKIKDEAIIKTTEVVVFRFRDGPGYSKFAEYTAGKDPHIFVCDDKKFKIITDVYTREEAIRIAKTAPGLASVSAAEINNTELISENIIWSSFK